uniref:Uncharacterized protein n=2 Tax=Anguilla anguilla TaxID=7936 RepID=A0A0E9UFA6_ANGAN
MNTGKMKCVLSKAGRSRNVLEAAIRAAQ